MIRNCRLLAALLVALFALTGCFKSDVPFISEAEADFPFKSITYEYEGEDDQVTLVKVGGAYAAPDEQGDATLLMKSLEDGLILVQAEINDSSKKFYLYSIIKPSADKKSAELIKPFAREEDQKVAASGQFGFQLCKQDIQMICLSDLQGYIDYAKPFSSAENKRIKILALE